MVLGFLTGKVSGGSFLYIDMPMLFYNMFKIIVIVLALLFALLITLPAIAVDLVLLIFTANTFPALSFIWDTVGNTLLMEWFWENTRGSALFFAAFILSMVSLAGMMQRSNY